MPNDVKLQEGHPVDENLRPLKVGGKSTALELADTDNGARIRGDLEVTGDIKGNVKDVELDLTKIVSNDLTIDDSGDISLDADGGEIYLKDNDATFGDFSTQGASSLTLYENGGASADDYFKISVATHGVTTISTVNALGLIADFTVDAGGDIALDSANGSFIAKKAGTEFSVANSAYAGMILGYTRIMNDGSGATDNIITINSSAMTVIQTTDGTDLSIQFIVPPSGNVEIQCSFWVNALSDGAKFSLSTASSYSELGITHTYDADQNFFIDETDHNIFNISFAVTGLTAGTDTTYYLAGLASGANVYINHGRFRLAQTHYPPIILKAIALPATIVTGE